MKLRLVRQDHECDGIFGTLYDDSQGSIAVTLEHAYDAQLGNGSYVPKLPNGTYTCKRGTHRLHNLVPFETFEVENVPGHTNILFHAGNFNADSDGCILVGFAVAKTPNGLMITDSKITFKNLLSKLEGLDSFTLIVE